MGADLLDRAVAVHSYEQTPLLVGVQQRPGGLEVDVHAVPDGLLVVVGAALDLGAPEQTGDEVLGIHVEADHGVERQGAL